MPKAKKDKKVTLAGGKNAHLVNPLGLVREYKAVCITENVVLSPQWRSTRAEARQDATTHIVNGHFIDYAVRIV